MNPYFEQMILSASPVELIRLLYQRAISSVRDAREHLRHGRITERCASINVAYAVLLELTGSLRDADAPELTANLKALYAYSQSRLIEANTNQRDEPLAEVLGLLTTLGEAWKAVPDAPWPQTASFNPYDSVVASRRMDEGIRYTASA
jgi:flagellar protein FliS